MSGHRLTLNGHYALAIERFRASIDLDPTVAAVHCDLGLASLKAGRMEEAASAFRGAIDLDPGCLKAYLHLAVALDHLGRTEEALAAYESAIGLDRGQHAAHARVGQIHLSNGRSAQGEASFRAAAAAAQAVGSSRAKIYQASAAKIAGMPAEAETLLRNLIADHPESGEAHVALGQILAESGQSEAAATSAERGIALDPEMAAAWYQVAINRKFSAEDHSIIERMRACVERSDLTPWQRQSIHFALGKVHDDLGDYAVAMSHFDAANAIRGTHANLDRTMLARQTDHVIASAPAGYRDRCPEPGVEDSTPILIVGMPRSGTTLVEQILSSHPDVAPGGELGFWRERNRAGLGVFDASASVEVARRIAADYLVALRAVSPNARRVTDKMPFNFAHLGVIHQLFPCAAIVHCRRHPVDTCLSIFSTNFETAFDFAADRSDLAFFYRQYQRLMEHWRTILPANRFIEIDYEALVSDPEPTTRRLIAGCGLEWNNLCLAPHRNQRRIATASLWQARQPIYRTSIERWRRYEPWLGDLLALLPASGQAAGSPV